MYGCCKMGCTNRSWGVRILQDVLFAYLQPSTVILSQSWIRMVPGSVLEDMLKDAGNCACDVWPLATHQRRSSLTSSLAEASGKDCNARLLPEFQAPLLRNVWLMGYVSCALYRFLRATPESGASRPFETKVLEMKGLLLVNRNVMKLIPSARALLRKLGI